MIGYQRLLCEVFDKTVGVIFIQRLEQKGII
jgi:hypothetical protein